jgi:MFS family permease
VLCALVGAAVGSFAGELARASQVHNGGPGGLAVGGAIYWSILMSIGMAVIGLATWPQRGTNQALFAAILLALFGGLIGSLAGGQLAWWSTWQWNWLAGAGLGVVWGAILGTVIEALSRRRRRPGSQPDDPETAA